MRELVRQAVVIDYGTLEGALPHDKIFPTDIDGSYEISGNFLFLETKFGDGPIPVGQRLYYERLTKKSSDIMVCFIVIDKVPTTKPGCYAFAPTKMRIGVDGEYKNISLDEFKVWLLDWYNASRANPKL